MGRRVLIVDDETNIRRTLADILSDRGYDVDTAGTGEQAVRMCSRRAYDFVVLDARMPGIDGIEAFRRIRVRRNDVRAIMMSAYCVDEMRREAVAEGMVDLMRKPLDLERLLRLIEGVGEPATPAVNENG